MAVHISEELMSFDPNVAKIRMRMLLDETSCYEGCRFKVGMSVDPVGRVVGVSTRNRIPSTHGRLNRTYRWGSQPLAIYILLRTYDYGRCQDAERDMIAILRDMVSEGQVMNRVGGGGGRRPIRFPYHVYLVRSG